MDLFDSLHVVEYRVEIVAGDTVYVRSGAGPIGACRELATGLFDEVNATLNQPGGFEREAPKPVRRKR